MTKLLNIILCLFSVGHINTYSQSIKFKIEANLKGYADNTGFKLQYGNPDEENKILLAKIKNEKLVFEGISKNKIAQYIIQTEIIDYLKARTTASHLLNGVWSKIITITKIMGQVHSCELNDDLQLYVALTRYREKRVHACAY
ncbi:MAG: hypothetical protein MUE72_08510 [Chitinophagaceae bacterium]|nr:hypothetical protein [Chitinophagaceae bacterium]